MVRKICLDSDVLVALLNGDERTRSFLQVLDADFYGTTVNSFELWYGRKKSENVKDLLESLHLVSFDLASSQLAADILLELKTKGELLELKDVFIAAMCITHNIEFYTYNKKHFERLKKFGLQLV